MSQILLLAGNFFILIISLVGVQACYFRCRWKWFCLTLLCVILSAMCIGIVVYQMVAPTANDSTIVNRAPITPL